MLQSWDPVTKNWECSFCPYSGYFEIFIMFSPSFMYQFFLYERVLGLFRNRQGGKTDFFPTLGKVDLDYFKLIIVIPIFSLVIGLGIAIEIKMDSTVGILGKVYSLSKDTPCIFVPEYTDHHHFLLLLYYFS